MTLGGALERHPTEPEIYRALGKVWLDRPRESLKQPSDGPYPLHPAVAARAASVDA